MAQDVHITTNTGVMFHNPGVAPALKGAGVPIVVMKDATGKTTSTSGQVPGGSVVHTNPA